MRLYPSLLRLIFHPGYRVPFLLRIIRRSEFRIRILIRISNIRNFIPDFLRLKHFKKVKNVNLAPNERIIGWLCNKEGKGERWKWGIGEIRPESRYIYITRGIDSGRVNFLVAFCQPPRVLPIQRNLTGVGCDRGVAPLSSFYLLSPLGKSFLIRKIWRGTFRKNVRMVLCKYYYLSSLLYVKDPYIYAVNRIIRRDRIWYWNWAFSLNWDCKSFKSQDPHFSLLNIFFLLFLIQSIPKYHLFISSLI